MNRIIWPLTLLLLMQATNIVSAAADEQEDDILMEEVDVWGEDLSDDFDDWLDDAYDDARNLERSLGRVHRDIGSRARRVIKRIAKEDCQVAVDTAQNMCKDAVYRSAQTCRRIGISAGVIVSLGSIRYGMPYFGIALSGTILLGTNEECNDKQYHGIMGCAIRHANASRQC